MNIKEAEELVSEEINKNSAHVDFKECVIMPEHTIEKDWGWVFFYQSKSYLETGNFEDMLAGNAPIIVNRKSAELTHTGTAFSIEHYLKEYEASIKNVT